LRVNLKRTDRGHCKTSRQRVGGRLEREDRSSKSAVGNSIGPLGTSKEEENRKCKKKRGPEGSKCDRRSKKDTKTCVEDRTHAAAKGRDGKSAFGWRDRK